MDRRTQFHFRQRDFVRGRPVARHNTARFLFGENRPSCAGLIRRGGARSGFFRRFVAGGFFAVPYRCLRMGTILRLLTAAVLFGLGELAPSAARAALEGEGAAHDGAAPSVPSRDLTIRVPDRAMPGDVHFEDPRVPEPRIP